MKCLPVLLASVALATTAVAQQRYQPGDGDIVTIWRTTYGPKNHQAGKAALLKALTPRLSTDGVIRMTIIAENTATGEVVSLQFSDPYGVSTGKRLNQHVQPALANIIKPVEKIEMRIFAHNNETHVPAVGDHLIFWWPMMKEGAHGAMKSHLKNKLIPALMGDSQNRDSYLLESDSSEKLLGVAISGPQQGRHDMHKKQFDSIRPQTSAPVRVERFRVVYVRHENK